MKNEFYSALGKKLRERRKALRMTQADLCGDYITRNMLSRIETGMAHPSLDTLLYISDRLKMPVEYFTTTDKRSEAQYRRIETVIEIRRLFATGQYHRCIDLALKIESDDDEINFIIAESYYMMAKDSMKTGLLKTCENLLKECIGYVEKCTYNCDILRSSSYFYLKLIESVKKGVLPGADIFTNETFTLLNSTFHVYLFSLCTENYSSFAIEALSSTAESYHIRAKQLMEREDYNGAASLLEKATDMKPGFFTMYFALIDLEICSQKTDNYKSAYEYTKRRLDLMEQFEK